jgi:gluconate 2-dehydrogenase alpha chain
MSTNLRRSWTVEHWGAAVGAPSAGAASAPVAATTAAAAASSSVLPQVASLTKSLPSARIPDEERYSAGRSGDDPATSVVDPLGRLHEVENVYVADGSVFVSSGGFNPTLTIMALALRTARGIH